jgi:hypothetical protein
MKPLPIREGHLCTVDGHQKHEKKNAAYGNRQKPSNALGYGHCNHPFFLNLFGLSILHLTAITSTSLLLADKGLCP